MSDKQVCIDELLAHRAWLERLAHTLVRDPHAAHDALQSTWLRALRRRPSRSTCVRAWLRKVLRHEVIQSIRSVARRREHEAFASAAELRDRDPDPQSELEFGELRTEVGRALRRLREPYRSTLQMYYGEDLTSPEIAERLGVPAATVRWRVKRGMAALRSSIGRTSARARSAPER